MKKFLIPNSDLKVSRIGLGGLHFGSLIKPNESRIIINKSLDRGINFIETASMYGSNKSPKIIGQSIKKKRSRIILSYKIGLEPIFKNNLFKCKIAKLDKNYILQKFNEGLFFLKTDWIDILQIHGFDKKTNIFEMLDTISYLIQIGKVRYFGFSNIDKKQLELVYKSKHPILKKLISIQLQFNIIERKAEKFFFNICKKKKLSIFFNQVFAKGILLNKYKNTKKFPKKTRAFSSIALRNNITQKVLKLTNDLEELSTSLKQEINQLLLSWTLSKFDNSICILGFSKKEHIVNYNKFKLTKNSKEIDYKIEQLLKKNFYNKTIYDKPKKFINL